MIPILRTRTHTHTLTHTYTHHGTYSSNIKMVQHLKINTIQHFTRYKEKIMIISKNTKKFQ